MPRWYWLLPLLAIAAWWPLDPYWQSDDFFAVHYAQHFGNVLHDFVGPQYGAADTWFFYRPLITASFWLDQQLGGAFPPVGHCSNVVAHGISTLLVAAIWRRFLPAGGAFLAALLWALLPSHAGSLAWGVGRVDSHTTVWCLLAVLLALRAQEHRLADMPWRRWPLAAATAAALCSKESALVVPALATLATFAREPGAFARRLRAAANSTAAAWLTLAVYLAWRLCVLGRLGGGYAASSYAPVPMLRGLALGLANVAVPLHWIGAPVDGAVPTNLWLAAAALPAAGAVLLACARGPRLAAGAVAAFAVAALPIASFLQFADNPQTLRLYYLPTVALCGLVARSGAPWVLAMLLAIGWPLVAMRSEQRTADQESATLHRAMLREAADGAAEPMFVAGLPRANAHGTVVQLHFGVDRLLQPPFADKPTRLFALRPLAPSPTVFRLFADGEPPPCLPGGSTWYAADASALVRVPTPVATLPDLEVSGDIDAGGVVDLTAPRLEALTPEDAPRQQLRIRDAAGPASQGPRPPIFRLTLFTATGYAATVFFDHADPASPDGIIDLRRWLAGDTKALAEARAAARSLTPIEGLQLGPAHFGLGASDYIGEIVGLPATMDFDPAFPVMLEAGTFDFATLQFTPTHRARRLLTFRFDRGYESWRRRVQGNG